MLENASMSELRTIQIDFDVHKAIEQERKSFSELPNAVLRRLLGLGGRSPSTVGTPTERRAWSGKGVTLPHGTELRMTYNGRQYSGFIEDGKWVVEGKTFSSPSAAAGGVALTKAGTYTNLDGWNYWKARRPGDTHWIEIYQLLRQ